MDLRTRVEDLMPDVRDELAELVAIRSVADPRQFPPEECHRAARWVLDRFAEDGYDLVLAGHTHGGQLRLPGYGALVTNCDLDRSRARGVSDWGDMKLHVSAGLGTSPYAPVRFCCRPEASLLDLVARP